MTPHINKIIFESVKRALSDEFIYHGTSKGAALNIQRDGLLKPNNTGEEQPSISFTKHFDYAKHYAISKGGKDKMVILRTPLTNDFKLSPRISDNADYEYITFGPVPTSKLEVLSKKGEWMPLQNWNVVFDEPLQENSHADYLKWKRKNVSYRGMKEIGEENGVTAKYGPGLYTAALSNKSMAKEYGEVYFAVNAIPKHPKIVFNTNEAEMFLQNIVNNYCKKHNMPYDTSFFYTHTTIVKEIINNGYDGLIIKGREMVNYKPENVLFFKTEEEVKNYYLYNVAKI